MSQPVKITFVVSLGIILLLCCLLPLAWIGYVEYAHLTQPHPPVNPDTEGIIVTTGTLEVIVPQARVPDDVDVSPTGRWLILPTKNTSH